MGEIERLIITYFDEKSYNNVSLKYCFWIKRIKYYTENDLNDLEIKKLFSNLVSKNYFIRIKNLTNSYLYKWKNYNNIVNDGYISFE